MIKITKPSQAPTVLTLRGKNKAAKHCSDYLLNPAEYNTGKLLFAFDDTIYGASTVKEALIKAQHKKCGFCERKTGQDGDVEHFRPKSGYRQTASGSLMRPGYYWLAYDWNNLLLSCSACNQRHKGNLFPLSNPTQRARSHTDDITLEDPLFLHPAKQDPEQHIGFRQEIPYAINGSLFGKETIKALGLDREILNEVRRDHLEKLKTFREIIALDAELSVHTEGRQLVQKARAFLAEAVTNAGEFASMSRAAAKAEFYVSL